MIVQRALDRVRVPWRNGRGVQYEIAADGPLPEGWTWRVSTADIDSDVPFSLYSGVLRDFCVAEGKGVVLTIGDVPHRCMLHSVTAFTGDDTVSATLVDGPVRALNLMRVEGSASFSWHILRAGESIAVPRVVVALADGALIRIDGQQIELATLDAVLAVEGRVVEVVRGTAAMC